MTNVEIALNAFKAGKWAEVDGRCGGCRGRLRDEGGMRGGWADGPLRRQAHRQPPRGRRRPRPGARKEMGNIDWNWSALELEHLVRGLNPWPSAFTHWEGKLLKIWMAKAVGEEQGTGNRRAEPEAEPGTVMVVTEDCLLIQTGNGLLSLTEVQLEGKKRMPVQDFLRGCRIQPGSRFERTGR